MLLLLLHIILNADEETRATRRRLFLLSYALQRRKNCQTAFADNDFSSSNDPVIGPIIFREGLRLKVGQIVKHKKIRPDPQSPETVRGVLRCNKTGNYCVASRNVAN